MNRMRMFIFGVLIGVLALACVAPSAMAQSVEIGGTKLELGWPKDGALAIISAQFNLSPTAAPDQYTLYPKRAPGAAADKPYPKAIGTITMENERLARITRNLGSFRSRDAAAAVEKMIAAFSNASGSGDAPSVHTGSNLAGDASTSRVYFSYPDRTIQIVVYRPADQAELATVNITEQYALRGNAAPATATPQ